jgi:hypothetical protein
MSDREDREAPSQAVNVAFYALVQMLESAGVIDQDKLADEIGRFDPGDRHILRANLEAVQSTLRNRPFAPKRIPLAVIDGGKADGAR